MVVGIVQDKVVLKNPRLPALGAIEIRALADARSQVPS